SEGFLESIPRKGTLVRSVRIEDLRGQLILREAIECEAARYYCGEPIVKNEKRLLQFAHRIDQINGVRHRAQGRAEYAFPLTLVQCADCPALETAFRKVMQQKLFMAINLYMTAHTSDTRDSHVRLLQKLRIRDEDQAEVIIRKHLRGDKEELYARRPR